jgi:hypothetical protein
MVQLIDGKSIGGKSISSRISDAIPADLNLNLLKQSGRCRRRTASA